MATTLCHHRRKSSRNTSRRSELSRRPASIRCPGKCFELRRVECETDDLTPDFGNGDTCFELMGGRDDRHHLVYVHCSQILEIEDCFPQELEEYILARNGFKAITHKLEFFGICPECQ